MSRDIATVLQQTATKILAELVFLIALPLEETNVQHAAPVTISKVTFTGPLSGTLVMKLTSHVLPELTANMLGIEDYNDLTSEDQLGSLTETLNIICGNFLPELAGKKNVFDIGQPMVISEDEAASCQKDQATASRVILALKDGLCQFDLIIDSWMN